MILDTLDGILDSPYTSDKDLTALIRPDPVDETGIYTNAIELLSSIQTSPSCNRLATSTLLESCQTLDGSSQNAEESLEDVRSVYAAQLAMCEIVSAGSAVPQTCKSLDVSPGTNIHQTSSFKNIRRNQLGLCLQSLESKPQWWTSYSNSKQNAMVMCQAARGDIEKGKCPCSILSSSNMVLDELIKLHKSAVETSADANAALSRAVKEANDGLSQLQSNFALAKQMFQDQLVHDLNVSSTKAQFILERWINDADTTVQSILGKIGLTVKAMESDAANVNEVSQSRRSRLTKASHLADLRRMST